MATNKLPAEVLEWAAREGKRIRMESLQQRRDALKKELLELGRRGIYPRTKWRKLHQLTADCDG